MMNIDWNLFAIGLATGSVAAALFFACLGWGMQLSLRTARPVAVLLSSSVLRIALLLIAGWCVATLGAAAAIGFALAFFTFRLVLVAMLRTAKGGAKWN